MKRNYKKAFLNRYWFHEIFSNFLFSFLQVWFKGLYSKVTFERDIVGSKLVSFSARKMQGIRVIKVPTTRSAKVTKILMTSKSVEKYVFQLNGISTLQAKIRTTTTLLSKMTLILAPIFWVVFPIRRFLHEKQFSMQINESIYYLLP